MRIKRFQLGLMIILSIWGCDKSDSATEPEELLNYTEEVSNFVPVSLGDSFLYNVDTLNHTSGEYENIGSRSTEIYKVEETPDRNIFRSTEFYNFLDGDIESESMFQLTQNSIMFLVIV
ncbi:MAG: hypothetical protein GY936_08625 [Ignavibacteriae bacterium]|nr:hypothetical protein [Ignavibacteriota bacterium]